MRLYILTNWIGWLMAKLRNKIYPEERILSLYSKRIASNRMKKKKTFVLSARSCCRLAIWKWILARKWEWRWTGRRWTFLIVSLTNWTSTVRTRVCSLTRGSGSRSFGTVSAFSKCPYLRRTEVNYAVFVVTLIPKSKMTLLCDKDE